MRSLLPILLLATSLSGCFIHCTEPEHAQCINATFITFGCCSGTTVFELDPGYAIGDTITLDGVTYQNAVQVAGEYDANAQLKLRAFNPESDAEKRSQRCWCIQAEPWHVLPLYVVQENCSVNFVE
jgi:hypothetical protein